MNSTNIGEKNYNLRPLWDSILDVYKEVREILLQNGLEHTVAYGTTLCAVRHRGFIPWDDDFDIQMKRAEFDKFVNLAENALPKHLKLITYKNSEFNDIFCKVQDVRKEKIRKIKGN